MPITLSGPLNVSSNGDFALTLSSPLTHETLPVDLYLFGDPLPSISGSIDIVAQLQHAPKALYSAWGSPQVGAAFRVEDTVDHHMLVTVVGTVHKLDFINKRLLIEVDYGWIVGCNLEDVTESEWSTFKFFGVPITFTGYFDSRTVNTDGVTPLVIFRPHWVIRHDAFSDVIIVRANLPLSPEDACTPSTKTSFRPVTMASTSRGMCTPPTRTAASSLPTPSPSPRRRKRKALLEELGEGPGADSKKLKVDISMDSPARRTRSRKVDLKMME